MKKVLRDAAVTLDVTFYSGETATEADGAVTIGITREDGTVLVAAGTATTNDPAVGVYKYTLAAQSQLDILTAKWTGVFGGATQTVRTTIEIVGGFYVALAEIRALQGLSSTTDFPLSKLQDARDWFEDEFEGFIGHALVRRYHRELLDGNGSDTIRLDKAFPRTIISAKIDGTAISSGDLAKWRLYRTGKVVRDDGGVFTASADLQNVEIAYEHGKDAPAEDVHSAALVAIRSKLLSEQSGVFADARSVETSSGSFTFDAARAIPEVERALQRLKLILGA